MNPATPDSFYFVKLTKIIYPGKNAAICDTWRYHRKMCLGKTRRVGQTSELVLKFS